MPLIHACIAPHAGDLIPETVTDLNIVKTTRQSMYALGDKLQALVPEVIVIINPHGFRVQGALSISIAERAVANWAPDVKLDFEMDSFLANEIADEVDLQGCRDRPTKGLPDSRPMRHQLRPF